MPYPLIALSVALLGLAHWFPYLRTLINRPIEHPVRLNINYTIGILCIFVPFTIWLTDERPTDPIWIAQVMWTFTTVSGLAVLGMYALDYGVAQLIKIWNEREANELRKRQADAERQRK